MKKMIPKSLALLGITMSAVFFQYTYAADIVSHVFTLQTSPGLGSNNSQITVDGDLSYINRGANSSVIGNYLIGYYYDSVLGFFQTDWSSNKAENIRIIGATSKCPSSYGYRFGGYSYSDTFGFIDFDFNDDIYVYYCDFDRSLHGYAFSEFLGFQSFEGITFEIEPVIDQIAETPDNDSFVNGGTDIVVSEEAIDSEEQNSNFTINTIQNDTIEFDARVESLFYIIK